MLRLIVTLDGEVVVGLDADIGYVHTGFEKNFEQKTYWKGIPYSPRMDYVAFFANELAYVGAVEQLIDIEVPAAGPVDPDALRRAEPHPQPPDLPGHVRRRDGRAVGLLLLPARARRVLDLFEMATGVRMHDRYPQFGGVAEDLPKGFYAECRKFCAMMPKRIDEYLDLLAGNPVWKSRYQGIGTISAETAIAMGLSGPNLRASGVGRTTCAASSRTSSTTRSTSRSSPPSRATRTPASCAARRRCTSRCGSSSSASTRCRRAR